MSDVYQTPPQAGRRFIVTGANSGTGKEIAGRLALAGAEVILAVRSPEKGLLAAEDIRAASPDAVLDVRALDLSSLDSVQEFADGVVADGRPVHGLVNNAGVMWPRERVETPDGFELQMGTNFFGPFVLTNLLLSTLRETPGARVTIMSSGAAAGGRIDFDNLTGMKGRYDMRRAYSNSKLANLLHGRRLATLSTENSWDVRVVMAHPGVTRTNLQTAGANLTRPADQQLPPVTRMALPSQTPDIGAEPLLYATTSPDAQHGGYYGPRWLFVGRTHPASVPRRGRSDADATRLWEAAAELTRRTPTE